MCLPENIWHAGNSDLENHSLFAGVVESADRILTFSRRMTPVFLVTSYLHALGHLLADRGGVLDRDFRNLLDALDRDPRMRSSLA